MKESEEKEVKTLESIREEIWEEMLRLEDKRKDQWADIKYQTLREVLQKLGHLDEPEVNSQIDKLANFIMSEVEGEPSQNQGAVDTAMRIIKSHQNQETLSQEWLDENKSSWTKLKIDGYYIPVEKLQNLLVPKQEKVEIKQSIAESMERYKEQGYTLKNFLVHANSEEHEKTFARAWLDGYEIEQEPKYYAKIKGHENIGSNDKYWNYNTDMEELSIGDSEVHPNVISEYMLKATKEEWANLGITDDNADFELVEETEE